MAQNQGIGSAEGDRKSAGRRDFPESRTWVGFSVTVTVTPTGKSFSSLLDEQSEEWRSDWLVPVSHGGLGAGGSSPPGPGSVLLTVRVGFPRRKALLFFVWCGRKKEMSRRPRTPPGEAERAGGVGGEPSVGGRGPRPSGTVLLCVRTSSVVRPCPVSFLIDGFNGGVERFGRFQMMEKGRADHFSDSHDPKHSPPNPGPMGGRGPSRFRVHPRHREEHAVPDVCGRQGGREGPSLDVIYIKAANV